MIKQVLIFFGLLLLSGPAGAVCTQNGTLTANIATVIVRANDISPPVGNAIQGRHYFMIQNTGVTNPMSVALGTNNGATTSDMYLAPGNSWVMTQQGNSLVPGGDVSAISAVGTTYSFCDW